MAVPDLSPKTRRSSFASVQRSSMEVFKKDYRKIHTAFAVLGSLVVA